MTQSILVPVTVFTAIVVILAAVVLAAREWLSPSGSVTVTVNRHRSVDVNRGSQLLWALCEHGIFLPAACGGRGSCGQCRICVSKGGGQMLPTESASISRREANEGMRLACMLTVYEDLERFR